MFKNLKRRAEGFTIIEVLIVLAIAGLIMLIVFLAVPALQRNQRNTGRRSDASRVAASADNFVTNNNGGVPGSTADADKIIADYGTLSQYGVFTSAFASPCAAPIATGVLTVCRATAAVTLTAAASVDGMVIGTGAQCNGTDSFALGSTRQMAMVYTLEGTGTTRTIACMNL